MPQEIDISVVVPLYNEEDNVRELHDSINRVLITLGKSYEILFVDDGSKDATLNRLLEIKQLNPLVKVIKFRRNFGQTAAMLAGFDYSCGRVVVSLDGDLQNDPQDIPRLLEKLESGYDLVCGWRKNRKDKLITRKVPSRIANGLISLITGVPVRDNGCSLKAYRGSIVKNISLYSDLHRFVPTMATLLGARITEIPVNHRERIHGESKYGLSRVLKVLLDLVAVKTITGFASQPMKWFILIGLPPLIIGLVCGGYAINSFIRYDYRSLYVIPSVSFIFISIFSSLVFSGLVAEIVLKTGKFKHVKVLSRVIEIS
ncbi:MAG: glycosyltransferase family 2 protein [Acidobacteria bacterium]|nr:glycosyltransferase family 2 protein [Acidobacteriota bacterium]MBI3656060.1 glycosyltransferase family 2 protein [Acidobacteriota bacterium]